MSHIDPIIRYINPTHKPHKTRGKFSMLTCYPVRPWHGLSVCQGERFKEWISRDPRELIGGPQSAFDGQSRPFTGAWQECACARTASQRALPGPSADRVGSMNGVWSILRVLSFGSYQKSTYDVTLVKPVSQTRFKGSPGLKWMCDLF